MGFGFSFGGGSNKSSGQFSGTDNTVTTSTPTNPEWVTNGMSDLWSGASALGKANPLSYVAGANPLQTQAQAGASGLSLDPAGYGNASAYDNAMVTQGKAPQTTAVQANPYISTYMDPYQSAVIDATKADMADQAGQTRAQQALALTRGSAFGSSNAPLAQALTEGQLALKNNTVLSGLRSQGYTQALGAAEQDAGRAQSSNDLNANLHSQMQDRRLQAARDEVAAANAQGENARQNIATQSTVGDQSRQIQQAIDSAPLSLQSWLQQYFSGLPTNLTQGGTEVSNETQSGTQSSKGKNSNFGFSFKQ